VASAHRAFTLIELMIVIAIIAILAAILIPNFMHARAESVTATCEGNEKQIAIAIEEYAVDSGGILPPSGTVAPALFGAANNPYMSNAPVDAVDGAAYTYSNPANAECNPPAAPAASYEILDSGKHDPTVHIGNAPAGATTVIYCSGSGINGK
jgi:prepilin-type N-terminal cleavage/methylation domain-containing protein